MAQNNVKRIAFNIYADSDEEAESGRQAIIMFINMVGQHGYKVSGNKIAEAVNKMKSNHFIATQVINFFKR